MRLLLDEWFDQRLARELQQHEVRTVPQMGWANLKNGELLSRAQRESDVFITVDRHLPHQQNLGQFHIAVLILRARTNRLANLKPLVPPILAALSSLIPGRRPS